MSAEPEPSKYRQLIYLCAVLVVYWLLIEYLGDRRSLPYVALYLLSTNLLLLAAAGIWIRRLPFPVSILSGGKRTAWMAAISGCLSLFLLWRMLSMGDGYRPADARMIVEAAMVIFVVPAAEELFFRGILLSHLRNNLGALAAAFVTSFIFAFMHLQKSAVIIFFFSLILCITVLVSESLIWALAIHVAWNAAVMLLEMQAGVPRYTLTALATLTVVALIIRGATSATRSADESPGDSPGGPA